MADEPASQMLRGVGVSPGRGAGVVVRVSDSVQEVLEAQAMMARDPGLAAEVRSRTGEGAAAARAVFDAFSRYREAHVGQVKSG